MDSRLKSAQPNGTASGLTKALLERKIMSQNGDKAFIAAIIAPFVGLFAAGAGGFFYGAMSATAAGFGPVAAFGAAVAGSFAGVLVLGMGVVATIFALNAGISIVRGASAVFNGIAGLYKRNTLKTMSPKAKPASTANEISNSKVNLQASFRLKSNKDSKVTLAPDGNPPDDDDHSIIEIEHALPGLPLPIVVHPTFLKEFAKAPQKSKAVRRKADVKM